MSGHALGLAGQLPARKSLWDCSLFLPAVSLLISFDTAASHPALFSPCCDLRFCVVRYLHRDGVVQSSSHVLPRVPACHAGPGSNSWERGGIETALQP